MSTTMKGFTLAGGAALMALASFGSAAAQQMNHNAPTLTVDNARDVPVTVYLDRGIFDTRLGTVPAHEVEKLNLPGSLEDGEDIQVFVHPEGGLDLATQDLQVRMGQNLDIYVPNNDVGYVPPPPAPTIPNPGEGTTTVTVQNNRDVPVTVFIEHGEFDTRIGTVPADKEITLLIPEWIVQQQSTAEIFVHPEGEGDLGSWSLELSKGAHLLVKVPVYGS
jgi:hypothetical protein